MQLEQNMTVGFIGQWAETPDWQMRVKRALAQEVSKLPRSETMEEDQQKITFLSSIDISRSKIFPHGVTAAQHAQRAQEVLLARQVDVTVLVNPGLVWDSNVVIDHVEVLEQVAKVLVIWTPPSIAEELPTEEEINTKPGIIPLKGGFATLSKLLVYLASVENLGVMKLNASDLRHDVQAPVRKKTEEELQSEITGEGIDAPVKRIPGDDGDTPEPDAFETGAASQ